MRRDRPAHRNTLSRSASDGMPQQSLVGKGRQLAMSTVERYRAKGLAKNTSSRVPDASIRGP